MFSSYADALAYLYQNLPMFQRVGASAYKGDLSNTIALCEALGNPQNKFKSVHIAGTNGKGSTSHMVASILQSSGFKTGLFTSPHLKEFTERIRINGEEVNQQFIVDFLNRIQPKLEQIRPSFFELTVAMAFDYFAIQQVDVAVIEVGLGGRLDSTNVVTPEVSVITNIGWDHKDILGDTLEKIAFEKAGIIKPGVPVVVSERQSKIDTVFLARARSLNTPIQFATDGYTVTTEQVAQGIQYNVFKNDEVVVSDLALPLQGLYQKKNLAGVMLAIEILKSKGWVIPPLAVEDGLVNVTSQTGLKGRWQKLSDKPLMICDTGHNMDGVREVLQQIKTLTFKTLHVVWGMVRDKDISDILAILPNDAKYYFCQAKIPRALDAMELAKKASDHGLTGIVKPDVNDAIATAKANASPEDMIFVGGSTFVVAEINNL